MSQVTFRNEEVFVIVDNETRSLRKDDKIILDQDEAWERARDYDDAIPITLEEYLKEIE